MRRCCCRYSQLAGNKHSGRVELAGNKHLRLDLWCLWGRPCPSTARTHASTARSCGGALTALQQVGSWEQWPWHAVKRGKAKPARSTPAAAAAVPQTELNVYEQFAIQHCKGLLAPPAVCHEIEEAVLDIKHQLQLATKSSVSFLARSVHAAAACVPASWFS